VSAVETTREGAVATVTLNTPDVRNALGPDLIEGVTQAFSELATEATCRVVILTGAGTAFCAGADLAWMRASRNLTESENVADAGRAQAMLVAVDRCPKGVVARVNGHAMGGGAGLVACADVAVAADGARFAFSEARLGLIPAMISPYVLRALGPGPTRALFTSARAFDAAEALRLGLVHEVVPADGLDAATAAWVELLLAAGPEAVAECKRLVRDASASLALPDLAERIARARASDEGQEGVTAFLEKRKPRWASSAGS
jgi:methylglutaconyl-CoA hydratase